MFGFFRKKDASKPPKNTGADNGAEAKMKALNEAFMRCYAPYTLPDFKPVPRDIGDIPLDDVPDSERLRILAHEVDIKRVDDPYIGAKLAGQEIYANLLEMLKTEKGVHIESLLAVIGAAGGYECMFGIMTTFYKLLDELELTVAAGGALSIYIAETKSDGKFLFGDRVGNEFCLFYMNAAKTSEPPIDTLKPLSAKAAATAGTPEYWQTPFDEKVGNSPKELSDMFCGKFNVTFKTLCLYPQERMIAWSIAAQLAVEQASKVISPDGFKTAMSIISEYGWRTSHFIG